MDVVALPTVRQLLWPTLVAIQRNGGSASNGAIWESVAGGDLFLDGTLLPVDQPRLESDLEHRLAWARSNLKGMGLVTNERQGVWSLTPRGHAMVARSGEGELEQLSHEYEGFRGAARSTRAWRDSLEYVAREVPPLPMTDRAYLQRFSTNALDLLLLDGLWTEAVDTRDAAAASLGHEMRARIDLVLGSTERLPALLAPFASYLDASWPGLLEASEHLDAHTFAFHRYLEEHGGLGTASLEFSRTLRAELAAERVDLLAKIVNLEAGELALSDLKWSRSLALGVVLVAAMVVVATPAAIAALGATGVAAAALHGVQALAGLVVVVIGPPLARVPT
jgi:hypothetical protein